MLSRGFMAAASQLRAGVSHLAMQREGGRILVRQDAAVWIGEINAGWSAGTRYFVIPNTFPSVAEPVELDGMVAINRNC